MILTIECNNPLGWELGGSLGFGSAHGPPCLFRDLIVCTAVILACNSLSCMTPYWSLSNSNTLNSRNENRHNGAWLFLMDRAREY